MDEFEWSGFISCGYVVVLFAGDACQEFDEESDRTHPFQLNVGIKTVTAALVWESQGLTGEELQYGLARDPCGGATCSTPTDYYGSADGASPLLLRIDGGSPQSFAGIEEPEDVQLRVFPPFYTVDLFLQQEFTIYYQLHYHEEAPPGYDPLPGN